MNTGNKPPRKFRTCYNCKDYKIETFQRGRLARAKFCSECFQYCRQCDGNGWIITRDERGRCNAAECPCLSIQKRVACFNAAGIPGIFHDSTFDNFQTYNNSLLKEVLDIARFSLKNHVKAQKKGLLLMGGVGVGKTRLVSAMLRKYILNYGVTGLFQEFSNLLSEIKTGYDKGISESVLLEKINNVDVLVIDELGKGRNSDWEINIMDAVITNRYNMDKITICATNYTNNPDTTYVDKSLKNGEKVKKQETLKERVHSRIYSRLREMCYFKEIKAADRRAIMD